MKISIYPPNVVISPLVFGVGKLPNVIHLDPKKNFRFGSDSYQLGLTKKKNKNLKSKRLNLIVRLTHTHNTHQTHSHRDRQQRDSTHSTADSPDSSHSSSHRLTDATVRSQSIASPWCADLCTLTTAAAASLLHLVQQLASWYICFLFLVYGRNGLICFALFPSELNPDFLSDPIQLWLDWIGSDYRSGLSLDDLFPTRLSQILDWSEPEFAHPSLVLIAKRVKLYLYIFLTVT